MTTPVRSGACARRRTSCCSGAIIRKPWTRPPDFHRESEMEALLDALKTFATITEDPIDRRGDVLFRSTEALRRAHKEIDQLRSRGMPDYDGWEARLVRAGGS